MHVGGIFFHSDEREFQPWYCTFDSLLFRGLFFCTCSISHLQALLTHPVLEVFAAVVEDFLKLDGAVGHKVVVADRCVVEDRQLDFVAVVDLRGELVVPCGGVGLLFSGGLSDAAVVHVQGDVRVQEERLVLGADGVTQWPGRRLELQSLADLDFQLSVEDHHGGGGGDEAFLALGVQPLNPAGAPPQPLEKI